MEALLYLHCFDFLISFYTGYLYKLGGKCALHVALNVLAKQYGDVFSLYLGNRLVVVLSRKNAIHESFTKKVKQFSGRPDIPSMKIGSEGCSGFGGCNVTQEYRQNKLLTVRGFQDFFSDRILFDKLMNKEAEKMRHLFDDLMLKSSSFFPLDYLTIIIPATMLCVLFGEDVSYSDPELLRLVKETIEQFELSEAGSPWDFLNYRIIHLLPNQKYDKLTKARRSKVQFAISKINECLDNEKNNLVF